jgi:hypothetical protein
LGEEGLVMATVSIWLPISIGNIKPWSILRKSLDMPREYYNGKSGDGLGLNPFRDWSVLVYFMLIEDTEDYNPIDFNVRKIKILGKDIFDLSLDMTTFKPIKD